MTTATLQIWPQGQAKKRRSRPILSQWVEATNVGGDKYRIARKSRDEKGLIDETINDKPLSYNAAILHLAERESGKDSLERRTVTDPRSFTMDTTESFTAGTHYSLVHPDMADNHPLINRAFRAAQSLFHPHDLLSRADIRTIYLYEKDDMTMIPKRMYYLAERLDSQNWIVSYIEDRSDTIRLLTKKEERVQDEAHVFHLMEEYEIKLKAHMYAHNHKLGYVGDGLIWRETDTGANHFARFMTDSLAADIIAATPAPALDGRRQTATRSKTGKTAKIPSRRTPT